MRNTRRIDVHHHIVTPQYIEELAKVGVVEAGGLPLTPLAQWTPEGSLAVMDRYEIDAALLSVSSPGVCFGHATKNRDMARSLNEFAAQCVARWPRRFGFFAVLPLPDVEAALSEIGYALYQLSADGIGLLSNYAGIYLGDPRFDAVFAELDRREAVIHLHPTVFTDSEIPSAKNAGSPIPTLPGSMLEFIFDTKRAVANLIFTATLTRYPHVRIILSHAGGTIPFVANRMVANSDIVTAFFKQVQAGQVAPPSPEMIEQLTRENREEAFRQLRGLYYDTALSANAHVLRALQFLVPPSQILLGTDYPPVQEVGTRSYLNKLATYPDWSPQDRSAIESGNSLGPLPRLHASA